MASHAELVFIFFSFFISFYDLLIRMSRESCNCTIISLLQSILPNIVLEYKTQKSRVPVDSVSIILPRRVAVTLSGLLPLAP